MIILLSFLFSFTIAAPNIALLREVIYSIFVYNMGNSKHRRKKADKIHRSQSVQSRITLSYTKAYITDYKNSFDVFYRTYCIYLPVCIALFPLLVILGCVLNPKTYAFFWYIVIILNLALFITVKAIARVGTDHRTKYDRT